MGEERGNAELAEQRSPEKSTERKRETKAVDERIRKEKERLEQQIRFITEVDKVKNIFRRLISRTESGKKMTPSIPGIWRSRRSF